MFISDQRYMMSKLSLIRKLEITKGLRTCRSGDHSVINLLLKATCTQWWTSCRLFTNKFGDPSASKTDTSGSDKEFTETLIFQHPRYVGNKFRFESKWKIPEYAKRPNTYRRTKSRKFDQFQTIEQDCAACDNNSTIQHGQDLVHDESADNSSPDLIDLEFTSKQLNPQREQKLHSLGKRPVLPGLGKREKNMTKARHVLRNIPKVEGEMLFGLHPVRLALEKRRRCPYCLYVRDGTMTDAVCNIVNRTDAISNVVKLAGQLDVPVRKVDLSTLDTYSNDRPHQGVCLDVSPLPMTWHRVDDTVHSRFDGDNFPLWLLLYHIQDPMNVGAILRSAYMFGVDRVLRTRNGSCSLSPVVSKASAGVLEVMDIYTVKGQIVDFIKSHQEMGWSIVGTGSQQSTGVNRRVTHTDDETRRDYEQSSQQISEKQQVPVQEFSFDKPAIVIVGNEGEGIPGYVLSQCDQILAVCNHTRDEHPVLDSLNVSVATGIILHSLSLVGQKK